MQFPLSNATLFSMQQTHVLAVVILLDIAVRAYCAALMMNLAHVVLIATITTLVVRTSKYWSATVSQQN